MSHVTDVAAPVFLPNPCETNFHAAHPHHTDRCQKFCTVHSIQTTGSALNWTANARQNLGSADNPKVVAGGSVSVVERCRCWIVGPVAVVLAVGRVGVAVAAAVGDGVAVAKERRQIAPVRWHGLYFGLVCGVVVWVVLVVKSGRVWNRPMMPLTAVHAAAVAVVVVAAVAVVAPLHCQKHGSRPTLVRPFRIGSLYDPRLGAHTPSQGTLTNLKSLPRV